MQLSQSVNILLSDATCCCGACPQQDETTKVDFECGHLNVAIGELHLFSSSLLVPLMATNTLELTVFISTVIDFHQMNDAISPARSILGKNCVLFTSQAFPFLDSKKILHRSRNFAPQN